MLLEKKLGGATECRYVIADFTLIDCGRPTLHFVGRPPEAVV